MKVKFLDWENIDEDSVFDEEEEEIISVNEGDWKFEGIVMNTIYNLDKNITSILISHRESALSRCDKIIKI